MIQKAKKEDFEGIFELLKQLWPHERLSSAITKKIFLKEFESKIYVVCKENNNIVGFLSMKILDSIQEQGPVGLIDAFIMKERFRGKGLGKQILSAAGTIAKERNCKEMHVYSSFKREKAHKFYEKNGFKKVSYYFTKEI